MSIRDCISDLTSQIACHHRSLPSRPSSEESLSKIALDDFEGCVEHFYNMLNHLHERDAMHPTFSEQAADAEEPDFRLWMTAMTLFFGMRARSLFPSLGGKSWKVRKPVRPRYVVGIIFIMSSLEHIEWHEQLRALRVSPRISRRPSKGNY